MTEQQESIIKARRWVSKAAYAVGYAEAAIRLGANAAADKAVAYLDKLDTQLADALNEPEDEESEPVKAPGRKREENIGIIKSLGAKMGYSFRGTWDTKEWTDKMDDESIAQWVEKALEMATRRGVI